MDFLLGLVQSKKRFVLVTTNTSSVTDRAVQQIRMEKARHLQSVGLQLVALDAHSDALVSFWPDPVAFFSCHVDSVKNRGIHELLVCILSSLPPQAGTQVLFGRSVWCAVCCVDSCATNRKGARRGLFEDRPQLFGWEAGAGLTAPKGGSPLAPRRWYSFWRVCHFSEHHISRRRAGVKVYRVIPTTLPQSHCCSTSFYDHFNNLIFTAPNTAIAAR